MSLTKIVVPRSAYVTVDWAVTDAAYQVKHFPMHTCETCIAAQACVFFSWLARLVGMSGEYYYYCSVPPKGAEFYYKVGDELVSIDDAQAYRLY